MAVRLGKLPGIVERRVAPRADLRLPLSVRVPSIEAAYAGEAMNISASGMFIATDAPPPLGSRVDVEVTLANGQLLLHASGEVVRHQKDPAGIGVHFTDVSYESQALIERMVSDVRWMGDYRLEEILGRGGMSEVYRAQALAGPRAGQVVAVKRMLPRLAKFPTYVELFRREGEITQALKHPAIVEVFEVKVVLDRMLIVMEYIDGFDLRQMIRECSRRNIRMPVDFACYVVHTVAVALDYAHHAPGPDGRSFGLVHRDINPANVFISHLGEVKLGDFGVAHRESLPEQDCAIAGKAGYQAPEHVADGVVSPAIDVFGLGVMLYELLTNRPAFAGETVAEIRARISAGAVESVSAVRSEVSSAVDQVVLRALSPRPPDENGLWRTAVRRLRGRDGPPRYVDAAAFAAAIDPLYDHGVGNQLAIAAVVRGLLGRNRR
jgi:uncharacterized protein (TIGR02266 family)